MITQNDIFTKRVILPINDDIEMIREKNKDNGALNNFLDVIYDIANNTYANLYYGHGTEICLSDLSLIKVILDKYTKLFCDEKFRNYYGGQE
jgi:hypothetical protein